MRRNGPGQQPAPTINAKTNGAAPLAPLGGRNAARSLATSYERPGGPARHPPPSAAGRCTTRTARACPTAPAGGRTHIAIALLCAIVDDPPQNATHSCASLWVQCLASGLNEPYNSLNPTICRMPSVGHPASTKYSGERHVSRTFLAATGSGTPWGIIARITALRNNMCKNTCGHKRVGRCSALSLQGLSTHTEARRTDGNFPNPNMHRSGMPMACSPSP